MLSLITFWCMLSYEAIMLYPHAVRLPESRECDLVHFIEPPFIYYYFVTDRSLFNTPRLTWLSVPDCRCRRPRRKQLTDMPLHNMTLGAKEVVIVLLKLGSMRIYSRHICSPFHALTSILPTLLNARIDNYPQLERQQQLLSSST